MARLSDNESGARLSRLAAGPRSSSPNISLPYSRPNSSQSYGSFKPVITIGIAMIIIGLSGYLLTGFTITALVPALIGLLFIILRLLASYSSSYSTERFAVHCAVIVGVIGLLAGLSGSVYSAIVWFSSGGFEQIIIFIISILTVLLCGIFCLVFINDEY